MNKPCQYGCEIIAKINSKHTKTNVVFEGVYMVLKVFTLVNETA